MNYLELMTKFLNKCENLSEEEIQRLKPFTFASRIAEYRQCKLDFGRQTHKSNDVAQFALEQKFKNPKRDIFILGRMANNTKQIYLEKIKEKGIKPIKDPEFLTVTNRALLNSSFYNRFRGITLNSPIFIIEEPMGLNSNEFICNLADHVACINQEPVVYIIGM